MRNNRINDNNGEHYLSIIKLWLRIVQFFIFTPHVLIPITLYIKRNENNSPLPIHGANFISAGYLLFNKENMKKLITIAILLSSFGVMAQSKKKPTAANQFSDNMPLTAATNEWLAQNKITAALPSALGLFSMPKVNYSWLVINSGLKQVLSIDRYPTQAEKPIESITIHVKRSNTVWLNDSTLVVKP